MKSFNQDGLLILAALVFLACAPSLISFFSLVFEIQTLCDTEPELCSAYRGTLLWTFLYISLGVFAGLWILSARKFWGLVFWIFVLISTCAIFYNYYNAPGDTFLSLIRIKLYSVRVLFEGGRAIMGFLLFWADFLSPIFLMIAVLLMKKISKAEGQDLARNMR
jgi:hypothetical protein